MNQKGIWTTIIVIIILALIYFLVSAFNTPAENETGESVDEDEEEVSEISTEEVTYHDNVTGYLARPEGEGPYPALVLIHEWWGLTEDVHDMAERFAREGYAALAVDLYNGESTDNPERARELVGQVRENTDAAFANLESALAYLRAEPYVDGASLASVGWCFGGGWAFNMAANDLDIDASVMYYGQFDLAHDFEHMRASILGHFGEEDASIAVDDVREFQATLETANGEHEVYIYPNVGHGFANYRGGDNMAYSEEAAELAWQRTLEFLESALQ